MPFKITLATTDDAVLLDALVNSAYRGESSKQGWTHEADLLGGIRTEVDSIKKIIGTPGTKILKYVEDGELLGCVELRNERTKLYLGMLTVRPKTQGKGIGKELLKEAEVEAKRQQCDAIHMTVLSQRHELIDWYIRHGYQKTGVTKPFPMDDPKFGLPKTQLEFIVMEKKI